MRLSLIHIFTAARECRRIITVEEHSIIGGLGEAVCSVVAEKLPVPVRRIGVMDQFGHSGPCLLYTSRCV